MPSEVRVSAQLGVSRGIVREAFRALKMAGVLEISNGRSPKVGKITDEGITHFLQHALSTNQATIEHVLDLRAAVEIRAAELAATNRTAKHVTALLEEVANMRAAEYERDRFIEADARFHEVIGRATGNPLFGLVAGALRGSMKASIRAGLENRTTRGELDQILATHTRIAEAICDRDPGQARAQMIVHFEEAFMSFARAQKMARARVAETSPAEADAALLLNGY
jgi:DNA-binding FadR family transcriptional regulator